MRDGTVGVLVCSCGFILEVPADPWGPGNRPTESDKRIHGTDGERGDLAELQGHPRRRPKPTDEEVLVELERRVEEQKCIEEEERTSNEVLLDAFIRRYYGRPRFD